MSKAITSDTTIDPIEAAKQIAEKAANQRKEIEAERQTAVARLNTAQAELHTLNAAVQARTTTLTQAEQHKANAEHAWQDAKSYATLAQGTIGEAQAVKVAAKAEKIAHKVKDTDSYDG